MANKEYLEMLLQENVQLFGEDAPSTLDLKRQLREIERRKLSDHGPQLLAFQAGFRKANRSKSARRNRPFKLKSATGSS